LLQPVQYLDQVAAEDLPPAQPQHRYQEPPLEGAAAPVHHQLDPGAAGYSYGMRQRLGVAAAAAVRPVSPCSL
jgi:hypothetical protein